MTENSPENLRKFLESDDPAMVQMGLSMAKGADLPKELLPTILRFYMWDKDKTVRSAAKSVFTKWAPDEIQAKVKENWKANYRTISITGDKYPDIIKPFLDAFKSNDDIAMIVLTPLLNIYSKKIESTDWEHWGQKLKLGEKRRKAGQNLAKIADIRTLGTLTRILLRKNENSYLQIWAAKALGNIGDSQAVEPLIASLDSNFANDSTSELAKIGDARAIKPILLRYLNYGRKPHEDSPGFTAAARAACKKALNRGKWKWTNEPEVKEIIKLLEGGRTKIEPKPPENRYPTRPLQVPDIDAIHNGAGNVFTSTQLEIRKKWHEYRRKRSEYQNWEKFRKPWAQAFVVMVRLQVELFPQIQPIYLHQYGQ